MKKNIYKLFLSGLAIVLVILTVSYDAYATQLNQSTGILADEENIEKIKNEEGSEALEDKNEAGETEVSEGEIETTEEEVLEPISDGKMILIMLCFMVLFALPIVAFGAIGYKKNGFSEKSGRRDVF